MAPRVTDLSGLRRRPHQRPRRRHQPAALDERPGLPRAARVRPGRRPAPRALALLGQGRRAAGAAVPRDPARPRHRAARRRAPSSYPRPRDFELAVSVATSIALRAVRDDFDTYLRCGPYLARGRERRRDDRRRLPFRGRRRRLPRAGRRCRRGGHRHGARRAGDRRGARPGRSSTRRRTASTAAPTGSSYAPTAGTRRGCATTARCARSRCRTWLGSRSCWRGACDDTGGAAGRRRRRRGPAADGGDPVHPRRHLRRPQLPRRRSGAGRACWSCWRSSPAGSTRAVWCYALGAVLPSRRSVRCPPCAGPAPTCCRPWRR